MEAVKAFSYRNIAAQTPISIFTYHKRQRTGHEGTHCMKRPRRCLQEGTMRKILVVVDMQNDFITGALGTLEAEAILPAVIKKIENYDGEVVFTRDTHDEDYLSSQEGKNLPILHCLRGDDGWALAPGIAELAEGKKIFDKGTFGSVELIEFLQEKQPKEIEFVGLCTDICVISNVVMAKAFLPEAEILVDSSCCAGVTEERQQSALDAMAALQVNV